VTDETGAEPLLSHPLLRRLPEEERSRVVASGVGRVLAKGEILFHEGGRAEAMYIVLAGRIKLVRYSPRGKELLLHLARPGDSFAEAALFGPGTYPATAEAVEDSRLWGLPRERLLEEFRRSPELGLSMVASLSMWTRRLASKLELLTQRRVEERLAIYLLGRAGGRPLEAGAVLRLPEAKQLIAAQCGTAPEVLSRTLRRLEDDGVLSSAGEIITIHDPTALQALAERIDEPHRDSQRGWT
jgi:CRP/FNR family transcriptional regulator, dissimilatory nitrate respiration regulator